MTEQAASALVAAYILFGIVVGFSAAIENMSENDRPCEAVCVGIAAGFFWPLVVVVTAINASLRCEDEDDTEDHDEKDDL